MLILDAGAFVAVERGDRDTVALEARANGRTGSGDLRCRGRAGVARRNGPEGTGGGRSGTADAVDASVVCWRSR